MSDSLVNVYDDERRAEAYAGLEFPGTYYLAFRDIPDIIAKHVTGNTALDFGCGAGRSTRFLKSHAFDVLAVDISEAMLVQALERDPGGDYLLVPDGDLRAIGPRRFSLVFCAFTFDNVTEASKGRLLGQLRNVLEDRGRLIILASAPEIYTHEWASFSTREYPENQTAKTGDVVRIVMLDVQDRRPVEDVFCTDADYRAVFGRVGLDLLETYRPLGRVDDPFAWTTEESVSPWVIYVLSREKAESHGVSVQEDR